MLGQTDRWTSRQVKFRDTVAGSPGSSNGHIQEKFVNSKISHIAKDTER